MPSVPDQPPPTLSCYNGTLVRLDILKSLCTTDLEGPVESGDLGANPGVCFAGSGVLAGGILLFHHPHPLAMLLPQLSAPEADAYGLQWTVLPSAFWLVSAGRK